MVTQKKNIFITGCYRSGTTLLEKLLHNHKNICIASQPFPLFYVNVKSVYNLQINISRRYPLDHLFLENEYRPEDFSKFLNDYCVSDELLRNIFDDMVDYDGLWTPQILNFRDEFISGTFLDVYRQLNRIIEALFPKNGTLFVGEKEVLCEEYIPFLVNEGSKVIVVIRDPRDMITSLNFRNRDNLTGRNRPILYSLRAWRKSVAFALEFEDNDNFLWIKYEDLVRDPKDTLKRITNFLCVEGYHDHSFEEGILDQDNNLWRGNSSFNDLKGVSANSVSRFTKVLSPSLVKYIQSCCYPEMKILGYQFLYNSAFEEASIRNFRSQFQVLHNKFPHDYSCSPDHLEEEIYRFRILEEPSGSISDKQVLSYFIYEKVYEKLRFGISANLR